MSSNWSGPYNKWVHRANAIGAAGLAPSLGALAYNARAFSVLQYIGQLLPPPPYMIRKEKSLIQRVLHVSNNTFPKCFPFLAKEYGLSQFSSLQANSFAARFRAASRTITSLESNRRALGEARACFGNLAMLGQLAHSLPWWDSPPIVDMVHQAAQGFGGQFGNLSAVVSEHARHHDADLSLGEKVKQLISTFCAGRSVCPHSPHALP